MSVPMPIHTQDTLPNQLARLRQFLNWLIIAVFGSVLLYSSAAVVLRSPSLAAFAVASLGLDALLFAARVQAGRGSLQRAIILTAAGIFCLGLVGVLVQPGVMSSVILAPIIAVAITLPYFDARSLRMMSIVAWAIAVVIVALGHFGSPFEALPPEVITLVLSFLIPAGIGIILLLLWHFHSRLTETLVQVNAANAALRDAQAGLETQVAERTAELQSALFEVEARAAEQARLLEENERQRQTIRELSVPVLPINPTTLVMPLVGALDSGRLAQLQEQALNAIQLSRARYLVLDITGVPIVDTQVALGLLTVVQSARLLGAEVRLVGIRPEVAQAIVGLGLNLHEVHTSSDLHSALGSMARSSQNSASEKNGTKGSSPLK